MSDFFADIIKQYFDFSYEACFALNVKILHNVFWGWLNAAATNGLHRKVLGVSLLLGPFPPTNFVRNSQGQRSILLIISLKRILGADSGFPEIIVSHLQSLFGVKYVLRMSNWKQKEMGSDQSALLKFAFPKKVSPRTVNSKRMRRKPLIRIVRSPFYRYCDFMQHRRLGEVGALEINNLN